MRADADSNEKGQDGEYGADDYYATYEDAPYGNVVCDDGWNPGNDRAYWRRRFLILCGGVAALAACAWLLPGPHQPSKSAAAAMSASAAAAARRQALPPAATGPSVQPKPKPKPVAVPTAVPTTSATFAEGTHKASEPGIARQSVPSGACAPADIVLSLLTSQPSYPKGARPTFNVYAVSTSATPCTLAYGAGSVDVVVTRQGHVVWDSAACALGPAAKVGFTLGVPQVLTLVWNPTAAKPTGCAGSLPAGATGTLDAVAMSHGQSSPVRSFKLAG